MRRLLRGGLLVGSLGLAVHLILPQIPGIERSLRLLADASYVLVGVAFLAELASELCYAELLGGWSAQRTPGGRGAGSCCGSP